MRQYSHLGHLLSEMGSWHVGCANQMRYEAAVDLADSNGWLQKRRHYAPMIPEGVDAWELTDKGLAQVGILCGPSVRAQAEKTRQWYRDNSSKPMDQRAPIAQPTEIRKKDSQS